MLRRSPQRSQHARPKVQVEDCTQKNEEEETAANLEMMAMYLLCFSIQMLPQPSVQFLGFIVLNLRKENDLAARCMHVYIKGNGQETHSSLGNYLVLMLAGIGSIASARHVFDRLVCKVDLSWNSLIVGYVENGKTDPALLLYQDMQRHAYLCPSSQTLITLLKACIKLKYLKRGINIHAEAARSGIFEQDLFVGNTVVDMYAKFGFLAVAKQVFDELPLRNEVSWNVLVSGYIEYGLLEDALELYDQMMQMQSVSPNAVTYLCTLKACGSTGSTYKGLEMHCEIERRGLSDRHLSVGSALIDMYAKCGWLAKGEEVFAGLAIKNVVSWTSLIAGYAQHGRGEEALRRFEEMQLEGVSPDAITYVWSLKACATVQGRSNCRDIHAEIERRGLLEGNMYVGSMLVDTYSRCGWLTKAKETLASLSVRDVAAWNAIISGYTEHGYFEEVIDCYNQMQLEGVSPDSVTYLCGLKACGYLEDTEKGVQIHVEIDRTGLLETDLVVGSTLVDMYARTGFLVKAQEVFDKLPDRDIVTWNTLLMGYAEGGQGEDALAFFERLQSEGLIADIATFISILKACGNVGATDVGQEVHSEIERKGLLVKEIVLGNTLIDMYAKWGWLVLAQTVFDKLPQRDIISWNSLMAGYAQLGQSICVSQLFNELRQECIRPDPVTFLIVLNACSRTCLVSQSQTYFDSMSKDYGIAPAYEHYSCIVDLLGRAGQLDTIATTVRKIPLCPDISLWHSVLDACQKWGNARLGKQAFEHALSMDRDDTVAFVLMSQVYASSGMLADGVELGQKEN